jgi:hypothetical protein
VALARSTGGSGDAFFARECYDGGEAAGAEALIFSAADAFGFAEADHD